MSLYIVTLVILHVVVGGELLQQCGSCYLQNNIQVPGWHAHLLPMVEMGEWFG